MSLPDPRHDNFWRKRILTDSEMAELIETVKAIEEEQRRIAQEFTEQVRVFLSAMLKNGYTIHSPEYKYVNTRIKPSLRHLTLGSNIRTVQSDLKRKAEEDRKAQEQKAREQERHRAELARIVEDAKTLGIDPLAYFGDESGLKKSVKIAKQQKLDQLLVEAPYYIRASFYGRCLRGDWSSGRDSYGLDELLELQIPPEDPNSERPVLRCLAIELREIAKEWDGGDGRDFRDTYQEMDAYLNEQETAMLEFMCRAHSDLNYGW